MRPALRIAGNLLIAASVLGLIALGTLFFLPEDAASPATNTTGPGGIQLPWFTGSARLAWVQQHDQRNRQPASPRAAASQEAALLDEAAPSRPITHVEIPSIALSADVVQADLIPVDGGYTWQVPAFKVGHAESTAGAGEVGNAVLLGHVTSVHSGNVFQGLSHVRLGDTIQLFSDADEFDYQVVSSTAVQRTDSTALQPSDIPSVTLITCTGVWLPTIWDYTERLVVHAELSR